MGAYLNSTANAIASVLLRVGNDTLGNDTLVQQAQVRRVGWVDGMLPSAMQHRACLAHCLCAPLVS